MSVSALSHDNIKVSPYTFTSIQSLVWTQAVNEHARLHLTGVVPEELKDSYVTDTQIGTPVTIEQADDQGKRTLFHGMVLNIKVRAVREVFYLDVEAVSYSYVMDIQRKSRSFQHSGMTIPELLARLASDYPGADIMDEATGGAAIGRLLLQYQETDWQFMKRIASHFQAGLLPAPTFEQPKIVVGVPDGDDRGELEAFNFSVKKRVSDFLYTKENAEFAVGEEDCIDYEVETLKLLNLGSKVDFQGKALYVREVHSELVDGLILHRYTLCPRNGMKPNPLFNDLLIGASIQGKVIGVSKDKVRVHLDIDSSAPEGSWWFTYSTVYAAGGSSGWYCMPEMGDRVIVHVPSRLAEEAVAISSLRQNNNAGSPSVKYFRSASGKEVKLTSEEITITGKDGEIFIRLHETEGIEIISKKNIQLKTEEDITLNAEKSIQISAKESLELTCRESKIRMDGHTEITGKEAKTN
ncbi:contractile injection system protein, VgrG/Pvc8 family [Paenibacillus hexagrammi]|uniref:Phage late control D family protein n=1 Tax=Paenibacillus hexagrammi TaxID=2908839 RepID=A0ABY3SG86_9BACL|nr:contractile injection system protein, VgrG/Pvc8 family [Paenibacillus sp. YPD9-1]UJF32211.1 phage late control D family protein [Paenibacillus sp. YPD9-1]